MYPIVHRDYETRSEIDLRKVGAHAYAEHYSTEIIAAVWIIETARGQLSDPFIWHSNEDGFPYAVRKLIDEGCTVMGHNAAFEMAIDTYLAGPRMGWPVPKLEQLDCTMARAAVQALPLDLDRLARVFDLPFRKDEEGHRLMMRMCKPRKPRKGEPTNQVLWHYDAERLQRLTEYCIADVRAEIAVAHCLRPLQDQERPVWLLDQVMNNRGVQIDTDFVRIAKEFITGAAQQADRRMAAITSGMVDKVSNIGGLKEFAKAQGVEFKTIEKTRRNGEEYDAEVADKEALQDMLAGELPALVRKAFELRLEAGKTSLKKLDRFLTQAPHGRARGNLQYHAAGPGRWAGRGIQLQNLVRRGIDEPGGWDQAYRDLQKLDLETFEFAWGSPFDVVSRMMRGAVIAAPGKKLYYADYASVEARGCVWAADQQDVVALFARDGKIYEETAAKIFDVPVENVTKEQRYLGKQTTLGCGYGMGWRKFQATCKRQGRVVLSDDLARRAVHGWRGINYRVVEFWDELETAARAAIGDPGRKFTAGPFAYCVHENWLQCRLPSGRIMWYRHPSLKVVEGPTGLRSLKIHYWGVNSMTKQWAPEATWGGKLLENCVQGMCADFLRSALLKLEGAKYYPVLSVHDEVISEVDEGFGSIDEYVKIVSQVPQWAAGFPLKVEGGEGKRYAK